MKNFRLLAVSTIACAGFLSNTAAGFAAPAVSMSSACFIAPAVGKPAVVSLSGSGFTPGEQVFAQIPAPGGLLTFGETTVTAQGTISAQLPAVFPSSIEPIAQAETMQIKGILSGVILAEAHFDLAIRGIALHPVSARPKKKVTFEFAGFTPGQPIFGHYLHGAHVTLTHRFGKAAGPCGTLKSKSEVYPGKSRYSSYKVQFDDSKRYSKSSSPQVLSGITIFRF